MTEKMKFVVVIRKNSETEAIFGDDADAMDGDRKVLFCSDVDLSGYHARVRRVPSPKSKAASRGSVAPQTFWFPASDVALAFEYDARNPSVGFGR